MHDVGAWRLEAQLDLSMPLQAPRPAAETLARSLLPAVEVKTHAHAAPCRVGQRLDERLVDEQIGGDVDRARGLAQKRKIDALEIAGGRIANFDRRRCPKAWFPAWLVAGGRKSERDSMSRAPRARERAAPRLARRKIAHRRLAHRSLAHRALAG